MKRVYQSVLCLAALAVAACNKEGVQTAGESLCANAYISSSATKTVYEIGNYGEKAGTKVSWSDAESFNAYYDVNSPIVYIVWSVLSICLFFEDRLGHLIVLSAALMYFTGIIDTNKLQECKHIRRLTLMLHIYLVVLILTQHGGQYHIAIVFCINFSSPMVNCREKTLAFGRTLNQHHPT